MPTVPVYWTDFYGAAVLRVAKDGGEPEVLAADELRPSAIAAYGDSIYWTNGEASELRPRQIRMLSKIGGDIVTLAEDDSVPVDIAVDDSGVYWTNAAELKVIQR